jgi:hypothetical protein
MTGEPRKADFVAEHRRHVERDYVNYAMYFRENKHSESSPIRIITRGNVNAVCDQTGVSVMESADLIWNTIRISQYG